MGCQPCKEDPVTTNPLLSLPKKRIDRMKSRMIGYDDIVNTAERCSKIIAAEVESLETPPLTSDRSTETLRSDVTNTSLKPIGVLKTKPHKNVLVDDSW